MENETSQSTHLNKLNLVTLYTEMHAFIGLFATLYWEESRERTRKNTLQLQELPLFWGGFPQDLWVFLWEVLPIHPVDSLWGQALTLDEKACSQSPFQFIPKVFDRVEDRYLYRTPNSPNHVLGLALCTGAQSLWNRKVPSPNCSHKVGSIVQNVMVYWSIQFYLHWKKKVHLLRSKFP